MTPQQINLIKRWLILGAIVILGLVVFFWLFGRSYIEVVVKNPSQSGNLTYTITNQDGKKTTVQTTQNTIKKSVPKGAYTVMVQQNQTSYVGTTKTSGFLKKSVLSATLQSEKSRRFVGNNPAPCMFYNGQMLFSYECTGLYSRMATHVPATARIPTYIQYKFTGVLAGYIGGIITTSEGTLALIRSSDTDFTPQHQSIYKLSNDFASATKLTQVPVPDTNTAYAIQPYKNGFVVYSPTFDRILYYPSATAPPKNIAIERPKDTTQKPAFLSARGDSLLLAFSNNTEGEIASADETENSINGKVKNTFVLYENGTSKQLTFDKATYANVRLCGQQRICAVQGGELRIYDIRGKQPEQLFQYPDVDSLEASGKNVLAISGKNFISINPETGEGYSLYSITDYETCGIRTTPGGYLLCLIDPKHNKTALFIEEGKANPDRIDKQFLELQKMPEITKLTIYGPYIHVSPNFGNPEYNNTLRYFDFNPETKKKVSAKIRNKINELGIDRKTYTITIIGE